MKTTAQLINDIIIETQNDINAYLECDSVPMECYQADIDNKLTAMRESIKALLES